MSRKKSDFIKVTSVPDGAFKDFFKPGSNVQISEEDYIAGLGVTGTLVQDGDPLGTPVLDTQGTVNNIRNLENGPGVKSSVSPENGVTLEHNFQLGGSGVEILKDPAELSPTIRSLTPGTGIAIASSDGTIIITASGAPATADIVIVFSAADLPTPVADVITLITGKTYSLQGLIDLGNDRIVVPAGVEIFSENRLTRGFTSTTTGALITQNDGGAIVLRELLLSAPSGSIFDISGSSNFIGNDVLITGSAAVSLFTNIATAAFRNVSAVDTGSGVFGFKFAGTCGQFASDKGFFQNWTGVLFDFDTAVFTSGLIIGGGVRFITQAGSTAIKGAAASANFGTGATGLVYANSFTGAGIYLDTITVKDAQWAFFANDGVTDTRIDALLSMQSNAVATTIAITSTPVLIAGGWTVEETSQMTGTAAGRVTYNGEKDARLPVTASITVEPVSGGAANISGYIAVNGSIIANSKRASNASSGNPTSITIPWQYTFSPNDFVEVFVANEDTTVNVLVSSAILRVD